MECACGTNFVQVERRMDCPNCGRQILLGESSELADLRAKLAEAKAERDQLKRERDEAQAEAERLKNLVSKINDLAMPAGTVPARPTYWRRCQGCTAIVKEIESAALVTSTAGESIGD